MSWKREREKATVRAEDILALWAVIVYSQCGDTMEHSPSQNNIARELTPILLNPGLAVVWATKREGERGYD